MPKTRKPTEVTTPEGIPNPAAVEKPVPTKKRKATEPRTKNKTAAANTTDPVSEVPQDRVQPVKVNARGKRKTSEAYPKDTAKADDPFIDRAAAQSESSERINTRISGCSGSSQLRHTHNREETEVIEINVSPTSSDSGEPETSAPNQHSEIPGTQNQQHRPFGIPPPRKNRAIGSPRAGRHSKDSQAPRRSAPSGPVGNCKGNEAIDVWDFFQLENDRQECLFCKKLNSVKSQHKIKYYGKKTSTGILRTHLADAHLSEWVDACDKANITIKWPKVIDRVEEYRRQRDGRKTQRPATFQAGARMEYSDEAFVDALTNFIIAEDQSINVIESPHLRALFLMLRKELNDSDIPHRTTIRNRILQRLTEHLDNLKVEMEKFSVGKISFTMDMWSDTNLAPFMGVTAHWIQATMYDTPEGPKRKLVLRTDLIGFHRVPGRHTGEHMAQAFLFITDRLSITEKIGWITLDNASNNDTFAAAIARELGEKNIQFNEFENRVRCFPHIVNLACKAVISAITKIQYAEKDAPDFVPNSMRHAKTFVEAIERDPIASIRSSIRSIRSSSLRRQYFSETLKALGYENLQLIRDMDVRWSSTLLMISRAIELEIPIKKFLSGPDSELHKYQLSSAEWDALKTFETILSVPHAFQHILSFEKTPTLGYTIPAFQALISAWKEMQKSIPEASGIIQEGLIKLEEYENRLQCVPANILATILNPKCKLRFFEKKMPEFADEAKEIFIEHLQRYYKTPTASSQNPTSRKSDSSWASSLLGFDSPVKQSHGHTLENEIISYLHDTSQADDPISFWEINQLRWPTIFALAMDILPIQGSAVPCERVFSSGKETITARRNRISPMLMEALQILKFAIKNGHHLSFTEGMNREEELRNLEAAEKIQAVPENIALFINHLRSTVEDDSDSDTSSESEQDLDTRSEQEDSDSDND